MSQPKHPLLLHQQFEAQVRSTPSATAVFQGTASATYGELNTQASTIAESLMAKGIGAGYVLGLHLERSIEWVAAVIGILKTNAAVLPLPPSYPSARIREILYHASLDAVIDETTTLLDPELPVRTYNLDNLSSSLLPATVPETGSPDQIAFILCSSGSTGTPKLIARSHHSFQHRLHWTWETHPYTEGEVCCQKAHATTTHGIYELFEPLLRGVPVLIIDDRDARDLEVFWETIRSHGVTRLLIVPSALQATLDMPGFVVPPLQVVVLMGEYVSPELAARAIAAFPRPTHLYSIYGSTEASSTFVCDLHASYRPGQDLPLGLPISDDVRAFVLNSTLAPVHPGDIGTLHITGTPLFTEYFRSPKATASVIVSDTPHANRLYNTQDHVRLMPDGTLEFVGRGDNMIKIRGFRVDPKDVETALESHPGVSRAAVVARNSGSGQATLLAFVTPPEVDHEDLFQTLKDILPPYMIPSTITSIEHFPLTISGKLDRMQLLKKRAAHLVKAVTQRPLTETEHHIAEIWEEVIEEKEVPVDASFFEVGGSSLTVFAVVHRIRKAFELDRTILQEQSIYQYPTIETLAKYLDDLLSDSSAEQKEYATPVLVTLRKGTDGEQPPFYLISSAGGTIGAYEKLIKELKTSREIISIRDPFILGERDLFEGFPQWVDRYVEAIQKRQPHGPYTIGAYSSAGSFGYELAQRLRKSGEDVATLILIDPLALDRRNRWRYGWWALRATYSHPLLRMAVRIAGILRVPLVRALDGVLPRARTLSNMNNVEEYRRVTERAERDRRHIKNFSALFELNTGLPVALKDVDFAETPAKRPIDVLQKRIAQFMPDVEPAMIERIIRQYPIQVRMQHEYILQRYDGRVALFEPKTPYAGLVRALLSPYVLRLDASEIALGTPSAHTRQIIERFGPLESHYRCMRDEQFVQGLAESIDAVLTRRPSPLSEN